MFCAKCGAKIAEGKSFCPSCGTSATGKTASSEAPVAAAKKKKGKGCLIAVLIIAAIGTISKSTNHTIFLTNPFIYFKIENTQKALASLQP